MARSSEFIYYFVFDGKRTQTDRSTYCKAWREYFEDKEAGYDSGFAIGNMIDNYGGYAQKYAPTEQNGIYMDNINHLNDLVLERITSEYGQKEKQDTGGQTETVGILRFSQTFNRVYNIFIYCVICLSSF